MSVTDERPRFPTHRHKAIALLLVSLVGLCFVVGWENVATVMLFFAGVSVVTILLIVGWWVLLGWLDRDGWR